MMSQQTVAHIGTIGTLTTGGQRVHYTISLDLSRTEERARLLAVINALQKLKLSVIIQRGDYEEDSGVLDFIQTAFMHVERGALESHRAPDLLGLTVTVGVRVCGAPQDHLAWSK